MKGKTISLEANESISIKSALIEVLGLIKSKFVIYAKDFLKQ
ncbi:hypothetical protein [Cetobacterium sp. 2A]|nr:hypothetical protein [Cetobacterium sp. 2A]